MFFKNIYGKLEMIVVLNKGTIELLFLVGRHTWRVAAENEN